jgi:Cu-Zn family superoxide dismutase
MIIFSCADYRMMMRANLQAILMGVGTLLSTMGFTAQVSVPVYTTDTQHKLVGQVDFRDTALGLLITPNLEQVPEGLHGFHLHQHPDCNDMAMAAGGHYDPQKTGTHQGPYGNGHAGDLPVLYVDRTGEAHTPVLAPRLKTADLHGLTLMIHAGGDNYTDTPPLGGGGARWACGVIPD